MPTNDKDYLACYGLTTALGLCLAIWLAAGYGVYSCVFAGGGQ